MANAKISQLTELSDSSGDEYIEVIVPPYTAGTNRKILSANLGGFTSEFSRSFVEELLFDKNEIFYSNHIMTDDINFTVAVTGNLTSEASAARMIIQADGIHAINLSTSFLFKYGITSGQILEAGTYELYFLYTNGAVTINVPGVTSQASIITQLSAPGNFSAVADGENDIDLSWTDVSNESSYLIEYSANGSTGWLTLNAPAADSTTSTQGGLSPGQVVYYRIKAIGDGLNYSDSPYSSASGTTADPGDVTAPVGTFFPTNGSITHAINRPIVITFDEEIQDTDGTPLVNNQAGVITLKLTNSGGADIAHSWTLDATKKILTITPTTHYGVTQLVYVAYNNIEDVTGNEVTVAVSITFTTSTYTLLNGTTNGLRFNDILDTLWAVNDVNFWLELTVNDPDLGGTSHILIAKHDEPSNQKTFYLTQYLTDMYFAYFTTTGMRQIKWAGCVGAGEQIFVLRYDGSIDTNDGLDRAILLKNGATQGSKTLNITSSTITGSLRNVNAQLSCGTHVNASGTPLGNYLPSEVKDMIIRSNAGATVEINVPVIRLGTDTSGNERHGVWLS